MRCTILRVITTPEPAPNLDDNREWEVRIKVEDEILVGLLPVQPDRCGRAGRGTSRSGS